MYSFVLSFAARSLAAALLYMSFWPSLVSKFSLNPSTASAFTHATNPDCFHFFSRSFFSLTAFSSSTFQHQPSSHHIVQFRLICHTLPRYFPQYTRQLYSTIYPPCHQMFPLFLRVSPLPFYRRPHTHFFKFHNFINF